MLHGIILPNLFKFCLVLFTELHTLMMVTSLKISFMGYVYYAAIILDIRKW